MLREAEARSRDIGRRQRREGHRDLPKTEESHAERGQYTVQLRMRRWMMVGGEEAFQGQEGSREEEEGSLTVGAGG